MIYKIDKEGKQAPLKCTACKLPVSKGTYEKAKTHVLVQCEHCNKVMSKGFQNEVNVEYHTELMYNDTEIIVESCCKCKMDNAVKLNSNWICPDCNTVNMESDLETA